MLFILSKFLFLLCLYSMAEGQLLIKLPDDLILWERLKMNWKELLKSHLMTVYILLLILTHLAMIWPQFFQQAQKKFIRQHLMLGF
ncbi:unnamed protein product [Nezara viridula]|uniref:Neuropeptide n=1 Tax=Nezara viridula TaxID=85310 RepID=A0A9P0MVF3_NEZVI|nr:unnamed protein product [Nezara viridula]